MTGWAWLWTFLASPWCKGLPFDFLKHTGGCFYFIFSQQLVMTLLNIIFMSKTNCSLGLLNAHKRLHLSVYNLNLLTKSMTIINTKLHTAFKKKPCDLRSSKELPKDTVEWSNRLTEGQINSRKWLFGHFSRSINLCPTTWSAEAELHSGGLSVPSEERWGSCHPVHMAAAAMRLDTYAHCKPRLNMLLCWLFSPRA